MREVCDKFITFQGKMALFLSSLCPPVEKSFKGAQEKLEKIIQEGKSSPDPKETYQLWIKILEETYLTFLRSPEYSQLMNGALYALAELLAAQRKFSQTFLQLNSIVTSGEMDEVSKDFYLLKKRIKKIEKELEETRRAARPEQAGGKRRPLNGRGDFVKKNGPPKKKESHALQSFSSVSSLHETR